MAVLRFRTPGLPLPVEALLARVLPAADARERARLLGAGALGTARVSGTDWRPGDVLRDPARRLAPGTPCRLAVAHAPALEAALSDVWQVLAPGLPWRAGELPGGVGFVRVEERAGIARYRVEGGSGPLSGAAVAEALAAAGAPPLGDLERGGVAIEAGLQVHPGEKLPPGAWPAEPVFAPDLETGDPRAGLAVSAATGKALARGHPWVVRDPETGDVDRFRPGALVRVRASGAGADRELRVRVESGSPGEPVAARVWARGDARRESVEDRVVAALGRRAALRRSPSDPHGSDAFRLIHGEADGLPGLALDRLGPLLRALVSARCAEPLVERALDCARAVLRDELGTDPPTLVVTRLRRPPRGRLEGVRLARGPAPALDARGGLFVRERGLRFAVDPGLLTPERPRPGTGLFLDQRENRARVAARVAWRAGRGGPGGRYLNLFAHTGAFSVALLAAGASEVVSVDLSAAYLRWLERNLEANGLAGEGHRAVRSDGRRHLEGLDPADPAARFDGIVLDPPTAAAAGRRFWSVRGELETLAVRALAQLAPGGWLLLSRNDRRAAKVGEAWPEELTRRARVPLARIEPAPPGPDFPRRRGFPEGEPFRAWLLSRA